MLNVWILWTTRDKWRYTQNFCFKNWNLAIIPGKTRSLEASCRQVTTRKQRMTLRIGTPLWAVQYKWPENMLVTWDFQRLNAITCNCKNKNEIYRTKSRTQTNLQRPTKAKVPRVFWKRKLLQRFHCHNFLLLSVPFIRHPPPIHPREAATLMHSERWRCVGRESLKIGKILTTKEGIHS